MDSWSILLQLHFVNFGIIHSVLLISAGFFHTLAHIPVTPTLLLDDLPQYIYIITLMANTVTVATITLVFFVL